MMRSPACLYLFVLLIATEAYGQAPTIESITPDSAAVGDLVTIKGKNFGAATDSRSVKFKGKASKSPIWNTDSVIVAVPDGATSGEVVVTVGGNSSPGKAFVVKPPEYDQSSFEVLTGVGAVLAGVEATSYKISNDALTAANVGRKRPEILLGGGFIMPWRSGGKWI